MLLIQDKMVKEEIKDNNKDMKLKVLTYFILFFPTLIIAAIPDNINGNIFTSFAIKFLLVFYQLVVIKNFVDRYYGE